VRLARRLITILPAMTFAAAIETRRVHSVAGFTGNRTAFVSWHPCGDPASSNMLEVKHAKVKKALSQI
jgi:predicted ATPase with chaperone activity